MSRPLVVLASSRSRSPRARGAAAASAATTTGTAAPRRVRGVDDARRGDRRGDPGAATARSTRSGSTRRRRRASSPSSRCSAATSSRTSTTRSGGVGSGFVLNGEGEIATNAHVVTTGEVPDLREARQVYVEFADGNQVEAEVRGYDPESDIALLKVDPDGPHAAAAPARPLGRRRGRDAGRGDRLAVLREAVAVGRRRLGGRPLDRRAHRVPDLRRDPDRRGDQPRQLRRPARRRARPRDRDQPADQDEPAAAARASASRSRSTSRGARSSSCARAAKVAVRVPRRRDRGDLPAAQGALRPAGRARARGCRTSCAGGPAERGGAARRQRDETVFQVRHVPRPAAT